MKRPYWLPHLLRVLTLSTPQARLTIWAALTGLIYVAPFQLLANLSLLERLGWESAPSIGLTRAYWLVLHGRLEEAYSMNRLIYLVLAIGLPMLALDAVRIFRNMRDSRRPGSDGRCAKTE